MSFAAASNMYSAIGHEDEGADWPTHTSPQKTHTRGHHTLWRDGETNRQITQQRRCRSKGSTDSFMHNTKECIFAFLKEPPILFKSLQVLCKYSLQYSCIHTDSTKPWRATKTIQAWAYTGLVCLAFSRHRVRGDSLEMDSRIHVQHRKSRTAVKSHKTYCCWAPQRHCLEIDEKEHFHFYELLHCVVNRK